MPKELKPDFDAVKVAYVDWLTSRDDFFGEADDIAAKEAVNTSVHRLVSGAVAAGVPAADVVEALRKQLPEAAGHGFFESAITQGPYVPAPATPFAPSPVAPAPISRACPECGVGVSAGAQFCAQCGVAIPEPSIAELLPIIESLAAQVRLLEARQQTHPGLPNTKILSPSFLTRAFAIYGHAAVVGAIVGIPIYIVSYVFFLLVGLALS